MVDHPASLPYDLPRGPPPEKKVAREKPKTTELVSESEAKSNPNKDISTPDDEVLLDEDLRDAVSSDRYTRSKTIKDTVSHSTLSYESCQNRDQAASMRETLKTHFKSSVITSSVEPVSCNVGVVSPVRKNGKGKRLRSGLSPGTSSSLTQPFLKSTDDAPDPNIPDDSLDLWESDDSGDNYIDDDNSDEKDDVNDRALDSKMSALDRALNERLREAASMAVGMRVDVWNKDLKKVLHSGENEVSPQNIIELKIEKFFSDQL